VQDEQAKVKLVLGDEREGDARPEIHPNPHWPEAEGDVRPGVPPGPEEDEEDVRTALMACFEGKRRLGEVLLHSLALAQQLVEGQGPAWRRLIYDRRFLALRLLVYPPGPPHPGPQPHVTTRPHTDGAWLTLLTTDAVGGLQVRG
jgi:isopenicillin N synthase-like dioxygenase